MLDYYGFEDRFWMVDVGFFFFFGCCCYCVEFILVIDVVNG